MSIYTLARGIYRWADRALLRHVPQRWNLRLRGVLLRVAKRLFPSRIAARSPGEFARTAPSQRMEAVRLPEWARDEVAGLAAIEPMLAGLVAADAKVEHYVIPWDMTYVGHRYALARRQLHGNYACMLIIGGAATAVSAAALDRLPHPLAVIDVDGTTAIAPLARAAHADYVALPAEDLDANDHCAVMARLVLQLAPRQLLHAAHPRIDLCLARHGAALATVSGLSPWATLPSTMLPG